MQENTSQEPVLTENMNVTTDTSGKSPNILLYLFSGLGIAIISFGLGYLMRGSSIRYSSPEELMAPASDFQEERIVPVDDIQQKTTVVTESDDEFVYKQDEFGFSLTLPAKFNVLSTNVTYTNQVSVDFYLPIESQSGSIENLFTIVRYAPGSDIDSSDTIAQKLGVSEDGYTYYFYQSLDVGLMQEQPEYDVYMNLVDQPLFTVVKNGFKLL